MDRNALRIMAKAPRPGHCKTRLCPPLTYEQAAELYQGFLLDTLTLVQQTIVDGVPLTNIALIHPEGDAEPLRALVPSSIGLHIQAGTHLGTALHGAFEAAFSEGAQRVIVISTDSPDIPGSFISTAFAALDDADVVLGPSQDGGYYLIGLVCSQPLLFEGISWSTDVVYAQTLKRAADAGLHVFALPLWYDVDTIKELKLLSRNLDRLPATRAILHKVAGTL